MLTMIAFATTVTGVFIGLETNRGKTSFWLITIGVSIALYSFAIGAPR